MYRATLPCLLDQVWTTPHIEELQLSPDGGLLARLEGPVSFDQFLGAGKVLIRSIHFRHARCVASVA